MHTRAIIAACLLLLGGLGVLPVAAQDDPPCDGAPALGEGEQYVEHTLYFANAETVAEVGAVTGSRGELTPTRSMASQSSYDLMVQSRGASLGDSQAASWRTALDGSQRIACWGVTWFDIGGQPATVSLFVDAADGDAPLAAPLTQQVSATDARTTRTVPLAPVDVTATQALAVQIGADAGAVEFDAFGASSKLTYHTIEETLPEPDVLVVDIAFDPKTLTVQAGDTVTWAWDADIPHDVKSDGCHEGAQSPECLFNSGVPQTGSPDTTRFSVTFDEPGTYGYHCSLHLPSHVGTIIVQ